MPRSRIGPLAIESPLGSNPTSRDARVWRAVHVSQRKAVAVRVFHLAFGGTQESRTEFSEEWDRLKKLTHPAICQCYGGGFDASDAYLVHELIEGPTLADEIERRGRLPWESVLELAEPIADAISYLHQQGIVHGRIAPDKIMIAGLSPVLVDVRLEDGSAPFRDGPYHFQRPPSPQQIQRRPPEAAGMHDALTPRSDLYQFGAVMYEALTGLPPISGSTLQETTANLQYQQPTKVASSVMDTPVWMDTLVMQLLAKEPTERPVSADAVKLQLAEVRRRSMSRSGVAEHASSGFSPLAVTNQADRDEARSLLGRGAVAPKRDRSMDATPWHDKALVLLPVLGVLLALLVWIAWPPNPDTMRQRAEELLDEGTRSSMSQARISYLEPLVHQYPDGEHFTWASEQIDRVQMLEAEHALTVKLNRNLPLKNEAERLCAEAMRYETFGDNATAIDKYRSLVTLLGEESAGKEPGKYAEYRPLVNLARTKIARISAADTDQSEAARIISAKLDAADQLYLEGRTIAAKEIWYSIVELYATNSAVAPLVQTAQERIAETSASSAGATETSP
ncbi:serine/threonine-protein kinase [Allorhodopirellula solitaria]|uniref:Serine/threonine-protein kinase PknL n=1 Tax=Allorhodopirellula solitaria TaxID=2527987 RepID=A0A5C5X935_9BACT|nr:serine/threonine-protein kinase [Allorhodopirellula solitaria]TWT59229.1 Serine/threonine-protein kinase PknL [Allorhodopirellula solitaria]